MIRSLLAALLFTIIPVGLGGTGGGGGPGSGGVVAAFSCRSFGTTFNSGSAVTIERATPVMCWASASTVNGVPVNEAGWVPEVTFAWDWDDTSLGSVVRGGVTRDLGKSVGVVAAHVFRPTSFPDLLFTDNVFNHDVTLTVCAVVSGARSCGTPATATLISVDPASVISIFSGNVTCYGDDADCTDDAGASGSWTNGGDGRTILSGIIQACSVGPRHIRLKGGVTYSTGATNINIGAFPCLVEGYGAGRPSFKFTNSPTSNSYIRPNHANCAGYRINGIDFIGSGAGKVLSVTPASAVGSGCATIIDADFSDVPGEEFNGLTVTSTAGTTMAPELYFFKVRFDHSTHAPTVGSTTVAYFQAQYVAFVGGELTDSGEHDLRGAQWSHLVIDSMLFATPNNGNHLITLRHDCGGAPPYATCPRSASAGLGAVTRNQLDVIGVNTIPFQIGKSGSGNFEATKIFDLDIRDNTFRALASHGADQYISVSIDNPLSEARRFRIDGNAAEFSGFTSSPSNLWKHNTDPAAVGPGTISDFTFVSNAIVCANPATCVESSYGVATGGQAMLNGSNVAKNNVCFENGVGTCNQFPTYVEDGTNRSFTADPFDRAGGLPGTFHSFLMTDLGILNTNTTLKGLGSVSACTVDQIDGDTLPQSGDEDVNQCIDDE